MLKRALDRLIWEAGKISVVRQRNVRRELNNWMLTGKTGPTPHAMKQANLRRLAQRFHTPVFVETGTCRADMLYALHDDFQKLISVELSEELCAYSRERCANFLNVDIRQGDSATVLESICEELDGRVLFWLDGHYSGGDTACGGTISPIVAELNAIRRHHRIEPIVVIDDARLFKQGTGYPELAEIFSHFENWPAPMNVSVHDDAIVALPRALLFAADAT